MHLDPDLGALKNPSGMQQSSGYVGRHAEKPKAWIALLSVFFCPISSFRRRTQLTSRARTVQYIQTPPSLSHQVLTVSDRASTGVYEDLSGPAILKFFSDAVESPW